MADIFEDKEKTAIDTPAVAPQPLPDNSAEAAATLADPLKDTSIEEASLAGASGRQKPRPKKDRRSGSQIRHDLAKDKLLQYANRVDSDGNKVLSDERIRSIETLVGSTNSLQYMTTISSRGAALASALDLPGKTRVRSSDGSLHDRNYRVVDGFAADAAEQKRQTLERGKKGIALQGAELEDAANRETTFGQEQADRPEKQKHLNRMQEIDRLLGGENVITAKERNALNAERKENLLAMDKLQLRAGEQNLKSAEQAFDINAFMLADQPKAIEFRDEKRAIELRIGKGQAVSIEEKNKMNERVKEIEVELKQLSLSGAKRADEAGEARQPGALKDITVAEGLADKALLQQKKEGAYVAKLKTGLDNATAELAELEDNPSDDPEIQAANEKRAAALKSDIALKKNSYDLHTMSPEFLKRVDGEKRYALTKAALAPEATQADRDALLDYIGKEITLMSNIKNIEGAIDGTTTDKLNAQLLSLNEIAAKTMATKDKAVTKAKKDLTGPELTSTLSDINRSYAPFEMNVARLQKANAGKARIAKVIKAKYAAGKGTSGANLQDGPLSTPMGQGFNGTVGTDPSIIGGTPDAPGAIQMLESSESRPDVIAARKAWAQGSLENADEQIKTHKENAKNGILSATPERLKTLQDEKKYLEGIAENPESGIPKTQEEIDTFRSGSKRESSISRARDSGSIHIRNEKGVDVIPKELSPLNRDIELSVVRAASTSLRGQIANFVSSKGGFMKGLGGDDKDASEFIRRVGAAVQKHHKVNGQPVPGAKKVSDAIVVSLSEMNDAHKKRFAEFGAHKAQSATSGTVPKTANEFFGKTFIAEQSFLEALDKEIPGTIIPMPKNKR